MPLVFFEICVNQKFVSSTRRVEGRAYKPVWAPFGWRGFQIWKHFFCFLCCFIHFILFLLTIKYLLLLFLVFPSFFVLFSALIIFFWFFDLFFNSLKFVWIVKLNSLKFVWIWSLWLTLLVPLFFQFYLEINTYSFLVISFFF